MKKMSKFLSIVFTTLLLGSCKMGWMERIIDLDESYYKTEDEQMEQTENAVASLVSAINAKDSQAFLDCMSLTAKRNTTNQELLKGINEIFELFPNKIDDFEYIGRTWSSSSSGTGVIEEAYDSFVIPSGSKFYSIYYSYTITNTMYPSGIGFNLIRISDDKFAATLLDATDQEVEEIKKEYPGLDSSYGIFAEAGKDKDGYDRTFAINGSIFWGKNFDRTLTIKNVKSFIEAKMTAQSFIDEFGTPNVERSYSSDYKDMFYQITDEENHYIEVETHKGETGELMISKIYVRSPYKVGYLEKIYGN